VTFNSRLDENCGPAGAPTPCVALTISVDQVKGVAGVIVPGDYVNILVRTATANCGELSGGDGKIVSASDPARQPSTGTDGKVTICSPSRYLYQAAKVLLVDKSAVPQPGEVADANGTTTGGQTAGTASGNAGLLTLELTPQAAQLISSLEPGDFYLTLLPPKYKPTPLPQLDPFPSVLPGEDATQLTPYGPDGFPNK
jgi:hypothetical protein